MCVGEHRLRPMPGPEPMLLEPAYLPANFVDVDGFNSTTSWQDLPMFSDRKKGGNSDVRTPQGLSDEFQSY
jgi:hypothetical protein